MTLSTGTSGLYAQWDEIEQRMYEEVLGFLLEADWHGPEAIAHGITSSVMNKLDGYGIEDLKDALLSDAVVARAAIALYAAEREIDVDPKNYANALVRDEYEKGAGIVLREAIEEMGRGE